MVLCACENRNRALGLEEIEVDGAEQAFYAFGKDRVKFVMLPTFGWTVGRLNVGTASGNMGGRPSVSGEFEYKDGRSWSYEVGGDSARFGKQQFNLEDGDVFLMSSDFSVQQLRGTKAGDRHDENLKAVLAELLNSKRSE